MTFNGVMNLVCVISPKSVASGANYVKVWWQLYPQCLQKCRPKISFSIIWLVAILAEITVNECINEWHPCRRR